MERCILLFPMAAFPIQYQNSAIAIGTMWHHGILSQSDHAQSRLTLRNCMDCSLPGSSVHDILQARILEWVAMLSSRGSSQPRDRTCVSYLAVRFFTV